jgi:transcription elongation factor SPT5
MNPEAQTGLNPYGQAAQSGLLGVGGAARPPGREPAIGQFVIIVKGNHKGYKGICKDMNGPLARIELHTNNKTITIERTKLGIEQYVLLPRWRILRESA